VGPRIYPNIFKEHIYLAKCLKMSENVSFADFESLIHPDCKI